MKTLLVAINAKYIHTNLAVHTLKKYADTNLSTNVDISILETTINQSKELILRQIYKANPDIIGFSCYIWNMSLVIDLISTLKKVLPNTKIFLGGPEVSYDTYEVLTQTNADFILVGEGEKPFLQLMQNYDISKINSIAYLKNGELYETEKFPPIDLNEIPFPYGDTQLKDNRILYFETTRGCPFSCQYCLSGSRSTYEENNCVRSLSMERIKTDFKRFIDANVPQVKLVDRTFNYNKSRTIEIIKYLIEVDNGITNFHCEIAAELLNDEILDLLKTVRKDLFQFEIGVQSTNKETLTAIKRVTLPHILTPTIKRLQDCNNIHLHLDLIAGLPFEGVKEFKNSFNYVYSLAPDMLQLGFLKLLKGSGLYINREKYSYVYHNDAPYEVISTPNLSYSEVLELKMLEEMVEKYYNTGRYQQQLKYIVEFYDTPFDFYYKLSKYFEENGLHLLAHKKNADYTTLYNFLIEELKTNSKLDDYIIDNFCYLSIYDFYSHEKSHQYPEFFTRVREKYDSTVLFEFLEVEENIQKYLKDYEEFEIRQLMRMLSMEILPINPFTFAIEETKILFTYKSNGAIIIDD